MGYCHTGNCLQFGSEGLVVKAMDAYGVLDWCKAVRSSHFHALLVVITDVSTELPGFSEGSDLKDVADLAATLLQKDDEARSKLMDTIVAKEMAIFESLMDGRYVRGE